MARRKIRSGNNTTRSGHDLPEPLSATLAALLGEELSQLREALHQPAPVSIRLHPRKTFPATGEGIPWCSTGIYLNERPAFTFDPLLHAGAYYVQEPSSMFLEQAFKASGLSDRNILALDLCAAPGGKSTHLRALLSPGSLLIANEIDRQRQPALMENLWKWGQPNVVITGSAPQDLAALPGTFDLIVVDAPCSGEGMFRKDPFAWEQWTAELVLQCAKVQRGIVEHAWNALAPGGILIYCTCTWELAENEDQLLPLIREGAIPVEIPLKNEWRIVRSEMNGIAGYRFYPHRLKGEGFFLAILRRPGELHERKFRSATKTNNVELPFLCDRKSLHFTGKNGIQHAVAESWAGELDHIQHVLRTLAPGIPVAERKGTGWRPHAALALNRILDTNGLEKIELPHDQAIAYLKGQALPAKGERGTALAFHQGIALGWLHGAGNRWNNRWPPNWRIRSHEASTAEVPWAKRSADPGPA